MLNRSASRAMSRCVLKALPGRLDIKKHSRGTLFFLYFLYTIDTLGPKHPMKRMVNVLIKKGR